MELLTCSTFADALAGAFEILVRAFVAYFSKGKRKSKRSKDDFCGFHIEGCGFCKLDSWRLCVETKSIIFFGRHVLEHLYLSLSLSITDYLSALPAHQ